MLKHGFPGLYGLIFTQELYGLMLEHGLYGLVLGHGLYGLYDLQQDI